jgi:2-desacetyl-2-hydroxyethyl bacteriochlorophyllide A dehydrogenase
MSTSSTQVIFEAVARVAVRDVVVPPPEADQVQIRTLFSGISSGTEGWALRNEFTWEPTRFPCVPGYQRVGIVTALGAGVTEFELGQCVFATVSRKIGDVEMMWGGHVGLGNSPAKEVQLVPAGVDDLDAANAVVAQVGYNAAGRLTLEAGAWVVVYGDGLIGQCAAQAARARGYRVILVGHRDARLALGAKFSADHVINRKTSTRPIADAVREITGGKNVRGLLDSVQTVAAQKEYLGFLERESGQIVYCGFTPGETWADQGLLQQHQVTTHYVSGWTRARLAATLEEFARGRMRAKPLITHLLPSRDAASAYALIENKATDSLGITLDWRTT